MPWPLSWRGHKKVVPFLSFHEKVGFEASMSRFQCGHAICALAHKISVLIPYVKMPLINTPIPT